MTSGETLVALLPLGAGQFQNQSYLLGTGFALGELGALGYAYLASQDAAQAMNNLAVANQRDDLSDDQKSEYEGSINQYVSGKKQEQLIAFGTFALLWITGSTEAILNFHSSLPPPRIQKNRRRSLGLLHRIDGSYEFASEDDYRDSMLSLRKNKNLDIFYPKLSLDFSPSEKEIPHPAATLKWDF